MKRFFELIWLWIRNYFKHPVENIRQAKPIVPGRLYENFGYVCKAVPYSTSEREAVQKEDCHESCGLSQEVLLEQVKTVGLRDAEKIRAIQQEAANWNSLPMRCRFCAFNEKAIPCPFFNELADGTTVCDTHKYVIIKSPR